MPRLTPLVARWPPPRDTAGPLTVRIEGSSALTDTGSPFGAVIVLENKGDTALRGTLRVGLIDGWQAEPGDPQAFAIGARATARCEVSGASGRRRDYRGRPGGSLLPDSAGPAIRRRN